MASLYDLSAEYSALLDEYESAETDGEREEVVFKLIGMQDAISDKAEAYARIMRNKQAEVDALKSEVERLTEKRKAAENVIDRLKAALLDTMTVTNTDSIQTSIGKWRKQANPWACEVINADCIPEQYHIKQPDKIDKRALLDMFKNTGEIIDGVVFNQTIGIRFR